MTNKLSRKHPGIQPWADAPEVSLGGDGDLKNPVALVSEQAVSLLSPGGKLQHGRSLLWLMPSPLICSRVIFMTRASKSPTERLSQTFSKRRVRSFRTQSSLLSPLSESRSSELNTAAARAWANLSVIDILPHLAAEASRERRGRNVSPFAAVLPRQMGRLTAVL